MSHPPKIGKFSLFCLKKDKQKYMNNIDPYLRMKLPKLDAHPCG